MKRPWLLMLSMIAMTSAPASAEDGPAGLRSRPIAAVLRDPLPPEDLTYSERDGRIIITGPTFEYAVDPTTGALAALQARRGDRVVVRSTEPARLIVGRHDAAATTNVGQTSATSRSPERIVLTTNGTMRIGQESGDDLPYELVSTFFNDGVIVSRYTLRPTKDAAVEEIRYEVKAIGAFRNYLHKMRDDNGQNSAWGDLPQPGAATTFSTRTSCLQVCSPQAGLAIFTDRGASRATQGLDTAAVAVSARDGEEATVSLVQHIVHERPSADGFRLKAGEPFTFRVGLSLVPNRLPHPRRPDMRMFVWIGDAKNPYPADAEIHDAARLGYNLFQMHRVGTPGEPRPPAAELDRVIKTVHEAGMLFVWTVNADLMYANAPGVREVQDAGRWSQWQGFNYNGRYRDEMDPYCDLIATCLASPNGLADYRIATNTRMLDRYGVDGIYVDDNLAYANCTLHREHGHPEEVYDCLIELHEMNWRRRQNLRERVPHAVIIDHCAKSVVLPAICDFDGHLYGEGYNIASSDREWARYEFLRSMNAHGCLWPGGEERVRNSTESAYTFDLLTGGGQYIYLDWRLYPRKFPYATGVKEDEVQFVRAYNLAQYGFGMHESKPYYSSESDELFGTDAPGYRATIYRNEVWPDHLVVLANTNAKPGAASLTLRAPDRLGLDADGQYALLDALDGECRRLSGDDLRKPGAVGGRIPGGGVKLFHLRRLADDAPRHLWGGKRISERWDPATGRLTLELQGPRDSDAVVLLAAGAAPVGEVRVDGEAARFHLDAPRRTVHGSVHFGVSPVRIEVATSPDGHGKLPEAPIPRVELPGR